MRTGRWPTGCTSRTGARRLLPLVLVLGLGCGKEQPEPAKKPADWCERVAAGPAGTKPGPVAMSEAHALVRFFSTGPTYYEADEALASALEGAQVDWDEAALRYAEALQPVCALEATTEGLGPVRVEEVGPVAVIHPGTGDIVLPPSAEAVAIDLRGLPAAPELDGALRKALAAASTQPVARTPRVIRAFIGMTDERGLTTPAYTNDAVVRELPPLTPAGAKELPMAVLTGSTLAPAAARFAVDLRLASRAWLFGEDVATAVAEYRWAPIGKRGLAIRTEALKDNQGMVPDSVPADRALGASLETSLAGLAGLGAPPAVDRGGEVTRPEPGQRQVQAEPSRATRLSPGIARAGLVTIHGALRRFFPYFHQVGDRIDERLEETLAMVDAAPLNPDRMVALMDRFGEALQDGHARGFFQGRRNAGFVPAELDEVAGEVVVRRSDVPELLPGDTLVSIEGVPMADWLAPVYARTPAATPGYRFVRAMDELRTLQGPTLFGVRAPDGSLREVRVQPRPEAALNAFGLAPSIRHEGRLDDLGAPDLAYLNMTTEVLTSESQFLTALEDARSTRGLVIDMRGYPGGLSHYDVIPHLMPRRFFLPVFRPPLLVGPDMRDSMEYVNSIEPRAPTFDGPIVLLVGPGTISAAENFSMMLVGAHRVRVVGRRSAGTNGDITLLRLPGNGAFIFTGMEVLMPDHSPFHGIGIVPDVEVLPTAEDFAAGRDPELLKAIEVLRSGG